MMLFSSYNCIFVLCFIAIFSYLVQCDDNQVRIDDTMGDYVIADDLNRINVAILFTKASTNIDLQEKFRICVESLLKHATIDINFFIIGDADSQLIAKQQFSTVKDVKINYKILSLDTEILAKKMHEMVAKMQQHFSHSPKSYYGDSLFFLSIGIFKILDVNIKRLIMLDVDLKFKQDIRQLHALFNNFTSTQVIGIANDAQPVYRHVFWQYRNKNPDTRVGSPPPNGKPGFNSGVLLLDLEKMRQSKLYQSLITDESVTRLTEKYHFKGHLGDQDFFSLIGMEHEELFYVLPCTWNRQLCKWWKDHGYADVFDQYFICENNDPTKINIYHGNCNTPIPDDNDTIQQLESIKTQHDNTHDNSDYMDDDYEEEEEDDDDDDDDYDVDKTEL